MPIIDKHCNTKDISKSFGIDFDILKLEEIPSEDFRVAQLKRFKDKLKCCTLLRGVEYPNVLKCNKEKLDILSLF